MGGLGPDLHRLLATSYCLLCEQRPLAAARRDGARSFPRASAGRTSVFSGRGGRGSAAGEQIMFRNLNYGGRVSRSSLEVQKDVPK